MLLPGSVTAGDEWHHFGAAERAGGDVERDEVQPGDLSRPLRTTIDAVMTREHARAIGHRVEATLRRSHEEIATSQDQVAVSRELQSRDDAGADVAELTTQIETLRQALRTRTVIGKAMGLLMEREQLTSSQAFDVLRRASQRENRKLRDLAAELVAVHDQRVHSANRDAGTVRPVAAPTEHDVPAPSGSGVGTRTGRTSTASPHPRGGASPPVRVDPSAHPNRDLADPDGDVLRLGSPTR
jgi:ANTAR domain-containing protein